MIRYAVQEQCLAQNGIVDADAAPVVNDKDQCKINPWVGSGPEINLCIQRFVCISGDILGKGPSRVSYKYHDHIIVDE
jgi:hypothetical protein